MKSVLNRIRQIRIQKGYSQEYVSNLIGMEQAGYGLIETGKRRLTVDKLLQIALALETDVSVLLQNAPNFYENFKVPDLPLKNIAEEQEAIYQRNDLRIKLLEQENHLLKKALEDKEEIIRLLKQSKKE